MLHQRFKMAFSLLAFVLMDEGRKQQRMPPKSQSQLLSKFHPTKRPLLLSHFNHNYIPLHKHPSIQESTPSTPLFQPQEISQPSFSFAPTVNLTIVNPQTSNFNPSKKCLRNPHHHHNQHPLPHSPTRNPKSSHPSQSPSQNTTISPPKAPLTSGSAI